ncbi:outer membrane beta-barrel protein [Vibrio sp.]|uniref:outer membrane beta-barrel protein n=1 Tax=Vibrio sp. TaxID=678 RepID=UPI003D0A4B78
MKLSCLPVAAVAIFTADVHAAFESADHNLHKSDRPVYVGVDFAFANKTKLTAHGSSIEETSNFGHAGYNLVAGYEINSHRLVKLGLEAEYRQLGKIKYLDELDVSGRGLFVNVKPRFIVEYDFADVYLSLLGGVGSIDLDAHSPAYQVSESKSEAGYQLGIELGMEINHAINLVLGYRSSHVEVSNTNIIFSSGYIGGRYHF